MSHAYFPLSRRHCYNLDLDYLYNSLSAIVKPKPVISTADLESADRAYCLTELSARVDSCLPPYTVQQLYGQIFSIIQSKDTKNIVKKRF